MLSGKEKRNLRGRGSLLKPMVTIGKEGFAENNITFIYEAFSTRELIKIKILENSPLDKGKMVNLISEKMPDTELVQVIGNNLLLYRPLPGEG